MVATMGSGIDEATMATVLDFTDAVTSANRAGIMDVVPAYATVTVFYNPHDFPDPSGDSYQAVCRFIESCVGRPSNAPFHMEAKLVEIPVFYGGDHGPDMNVVCEHSGLSPDEVITMHYTAQYRVHAIGFTPGFPYLGGLPEKLRTPRRDTPRAHVPAGSVAIGGSQTGVYPVDSPGGWQIIGRTPMALFRPQEKRASRLWPGDRVRFMPITKEEFVSWRS